MSNIKDNLLQLIGKTPLVRLSNIYKDEYGTEIIAKVEYFNPDAIRVPRSWQNVPTIHFSS